MGNPRNWEFFTNIFNMNVILQFEKYLAAKPNGTEIVSHMIQSIAARNSDQQ